MRPQLAAVAATQGQVFTRRQALEAGYDECEIRGLSRDGGAWVRVRQGAYVPRDDWTAWDDDARYVASVKAGLLRGSPDAMASHQSAAALHRMPLRTRWRRQLHATRTGVQGTRRQAGMRIHPAVVAPTDEVLADGFRATSLARTAVDIAREWGYEDGVVAGDAALRMGAKRHDLDRIVASMWAWPGVKAARAVLLDVDGGAETIGESLARLLVLELGIGRPETQFQVTDGARTAYADMRIGNHLFEFDGRVKYVGREHGGLAGARVEEVLWAEKRREDWLRSLGYGVSRIVWDDLVAAGRRRARERLLREYHAGGGIAHAA
jgi:hypothetical protein